MNLNYKSLLLALASSLCILTTPAQNPDNTRTVMFYGRIIPLNSAVFPPGSGTAVVSNSTAYGLYNITATPNAKLKDVFVNWTVNDVVAGTKNPDLNFDPNLYTNDSSETVVANFGYDITTTSSPAVGGTNSGAGTYVIGQSVTLVA